MAIANPSGSDWRAKFKQLEKAFFSIAEADWEVALTQRIEEISSVYDDVRHRAHVQLLNTALRLGPPLTGGEFDKTITLIDLREQIVAPRVPANS